MRKVVGFSIPEIKFIIYEEGFTLLLISIKITITSSTELFKPRRYTVETNHACDFGFL